MINRYIAGALGSFLLIGIWFVVAKSNMINPLFIESPEIVFSKLVELLVSGDITVDLLLTLYRTLLGFAIAVMIGIPIGMALGHSKTIYNIFEPLVDFVRSIPIIALFPLFLLFFSIGDGSKIMMVAFTSSLVITLNTMYGIHHSNKTRSLLAKTLGASQFMIIRKVEFFEALPYVFTGLRLAISFSLVVVLFTEMLLAFTDYGLGLRIYDAYQVRKVAEMYALIVLSGLVGYIFNVGMKTMEKHVVHWTGKS